MNVKQHKKEIVMTA